MFTLDCADLGNRIKYFVGGDMVGIVMVWLY